MEEQTIKTTSTEFSSVIERLNTLLFKTSEKILNEQSLADLAHAMSHPTSIEIVRDISDEELIKLLEESGPNTTIIEASLPKNEPLFPICVFIDDKYFITKLISRGPILTILGTDHDDFETTSQVNEIFECFWKELAEIDKDFPNTPETTVIYE